MSLSWQSHLSLSCRFTPCLWSTSLKIYVGSKDWYQVSQGRISCIGLPEYYGLKKAQIFSTISLLYENQFLSSTHVNTQKKRVNTYLVSAVNFRLRHRNQMFPQNLFLETIVLIQSKTILIDSSHACFSELFVLFSELINIRLYCSLHVTCSISLESKDLQVRSSSLLAKLHPKSIQIKYLFGKFSEKSSIECVKNIHRPDQTRRYY
jgi:hypothetical protein